MSSQLPIAPNYQKHKEIARAIITERFRYFNMFYKFEFKSIRIKNQKSRWGSCSSNKNLNYNFKVAFLPAELRDYIIVHELCHLKELNHSPVFWRLIAQMFPNYKNLHLELKPYRLSE